MPPPDRTDGEVQQRLAAEMRLQVGAALLLGALVLIVIILRAGVHNIFPWGWWWRW